RQPAPAGSSRHPKAFLEEKSALVIPKSETLTVSCPANSMTDSKWSISDVIQRVAWNAKHGFFSARLYCCERNLHLEL
ncbi:MAG TPA: hypothetical protein VL127_12380, partial [Bryobacteraceae bacterium]|nr:hypothetical protein [Bryobacteraceae bacterium]